MVIFGGRSTDQSSYHNLGRDFYSNKVRLALMELSGLLINDDGI